MNGKIDQRLLDRVMIQRNVLQDCIIHFKTLADAKKYIATSCKNKEYTYFSSINSVSTKLSVSSMYLLAGLVEVNYISSNAKVCTMINVAKDIIGVNENCENKNFSTVVIDTGLYPHMDIMLSGRNKIIKFVDLVNGKNDIYDDNGHGTFITMLLSGNGYISGKKYAGVDKNSNLIIIKALDKNGETNAINILKAMQWVYDNANEYNIKIACMSFGSVVLENNDPLILGAEALWDKGIVVVSACGNSGPENGTIKSPSASSKIISVGAMDDGRVGDEYNIDNFKVAEFSSRGPILGNYKPDVIVSGVDVVSACNFGLTKKFYCTMSGTSVATPIVAGVVSRLIKKYPNHTPDQIKKILINNCKKITGDRNSEGFGWLCMKDVFN